MVERPEYGSPQEGAWPRRRPAPAGRFLFGTGLLILGALWTLDNLGLTDASQITRWWPVLLLVYGVLKLFGWCCNRSVFAGTMWLLAGGWLVLHAMGIVHPGVAGLWPLALIVIGVRYIAYPGRTRLRHRMDRGFVQGTEEDGRIKMEVVMSNAQRRVEPGPFRGGEISAVLASAELDLRGATLADGRVELEANAVMAGIQLFVPHGWQVVSVVSAMLGNVEDHTEKLPEGATPRATLYLRGAAVMGSIEIRN